MGRPTLEDAIALAALAHAGQVDKAGAPYALHPLRVMLRMETEEEQLVAVLHDVVEDTPYTLASLRRLGFSGTVVDALDALTRREDETYASFIERAGRNQLARRVKIADLEDNLDLGRIATPTPRDASRCERYRRALTVLETCGVDA